MFKMTLLQPLHMYLQCFPNQCLILVKQDNFVKLRNSLVLEKNMVADLCHFA